MFLDPVPERTCRLCPASALRLAARFCRSDSKRSIGPGDWSKWRARLVVSGWPCYALGDGWTGNEEGVFGRDGLGSHKLLTALRISELSRCSGGTHCVRGRSRGRVEGFLGRFPSLDAIHGHSAAFAPQSEGNRRPAAL